MFRIICPDYYVLIIMPESYMIYKFRSPAQPPDVQHSNIPYSLSCQPTFQRYLPFCHSRHESHLHRHSHTKTNHLNSDSIPLKNRYRQQISPPEWPFVPLTNHDTSKPCNYCFLLKGIKKSAPLTRSYPPNLSFTSTCDSRLCIIR